ncbi:hypothetical protein TNCT_312211 [Trichonephila clavata]|uniref:Gustatory receptor n=1 Tax=Trichonephila clavata TaxID=2740835 RepID=A0A8X6JZC7_TRICU|nr:hypothetical protein TNCT_312211 [Trichonephila clavata]
MKWANPHYVVSSTIPSCNRKAKVKSPYNYIFFLFHCAVVFPVTNCSRTDQRFGVINSILSLISIVITIAEIGATGYILNETVFKSDYLDPVDLSLIIMYVVTILHRCMLILKLEKMKRIALLLDRFETCNKSSRSGFAFLVVVAVLSQMILQLYTFFKKRDRLDMSPIKIEIDFGHQYHNGAPLFYNGSMLLFGKLPIIAFNFYYIAASNNLRRIILNFSAELTSGQVQNYETLRQSFGSIRSAVELTDKEIGIFVFLAIMYDFCVMLLALYVFLQSFALDDLYGRLIVYFHAFIAFSVLILMTWAASKVAEASNEVSSSAWNMPERKGNSISSQQRLIMYLEKETHLTLWGITPMKRSFIFGVVGAIFTYILMIYTL